MTKRRITPHKGGRTVSAPAARIRPQTLQRIRATMQERDKSFADLLEEQYSGGNTMAGVKANYHVGDVVNVKTRGKWSTEKREITGTFYTTLTGRMYEFNNGDVIPERDVRKAKGISPN